MLSRVRTWAGERLIQLGFRLLGVNVQAIAEQTKTTEVEEDENDSDDGFLSDHPIVSLSPEAKRMIQEAMPVPPKPVEEPPPLKGSAQERFMKARAAR